MKSNKLCRMKKKIFLPMLVSLQLLFGSCENNFDPYIYGALLQGEYPSTEQEYVSYMMICYLPYTTVWTYDMGSGVCNMAFIFRQAEWCVCLILLLIYVHMQRR